MKTHSALVHSRVKTPLPGAVSEHRPVGSPKSALSSGGTSYSREQPSQPWPSHAYGPRTSRKLAMSCSGLTSALGSPLQPPGENAYVIARVCAGELAEQSARSVGAHVGPWRTSGDVQQPFFADGLPWPFHICCHENIPRASTSS